MIGIALLFMSKRGIERRRLYMWFMILFGSTRFVFEFYRDNEKIWNGISELAFHAAGALVIGLIWLVATMWFFQKGEQKSEKN